MIRRPTRFEAEAIAIGAVMLVPLTLRVLSFLFG